jgi:hypothetical protein
MNHAVHGLTISDEQIPISHAREKQRGRRPGGGSHWKVWLVVALACFLGMVLLAQMLGQSLGTALLIAVLVVLGLIAVLGGLARRLLAMDRPWRLVKARRAQITALRQLSPAGFEDHVAGLFERAGYRVERVGGSGDGGVDVRVWHGGSYGIVQCKRYRTDRLVGPAVVRELVGARTHEQADTAWLVTTGRLTQGARQLAAAQRITLLDVEAMASWEARLRSRGEHEDCAGVRWAG